METKNTTNAGENKMTNQKLTIKITDSLKRWLGVERGEVFAAEYIEFYSRRSHAYKVINAAGETVHVPTWAAKPVKA